MKINNAFLQIMMTANSGLEKKLMKGIQTETRIAKKPAQGGSRSVAKKPPKTAPNESKQLQIGSGTSQKLKIVFTFFPNG